MLAVRTVREAGTIGKVRLAGGSGVDLGVARHTHPRGSWVGREYLLHWTEESGAAASL